MARTKECRAKVKAAGAADGLDEGQFTALVSVFGNEDSVGDVVTPGAFAETLAEWKGRGDPIPVIWSHDWGDPFSHVGVVLDAEETPDGLQVTAQIEDIDTNPKAGQVYRLLKSRRVTQFSFAYDVLEGAWVDTEDTKAHPYGSYYELRKLKLYEVGPCLIGANQETELLAAKARNLVHGLKEGRVLATRHYDRLVEAHSAIGDVLAAAEPQKTSEPAARRAAGEDTPAQETGQPQTEKTAAAVEAAAQSPVLSPAQVEAWATTTELTTRSTP